MTIIFFNNHCVIHHPAVLHLYHLARQYRMETQGGTHR